MHYGQVLVTAGCFKECNKVVLVVQGSIRPFQPLQSDNNEADTRMILHAHNASQDHDRVVIQSLDTDVAVLATHFFRSLSCKQLRFRTGIKDKPRFIPIHSLVECFGSDTCASLPCFHALTGCDSTSGNGIGKKKASMTLRKNVSSPNWEVNYHYHLTFRGHVKPSSAHFTQVQKCLKALQISCDTGCFPEKKEKRESFPPTTDSLHHYIERCNYQAMVWKSSTCQGILLQRDY